MPEVIGDNVDRLITVEMRPLGIPRGVIHHLYQLVRHRTDVSLTLQAARRLRGLALGGTVFIATGAGANPVLPVGETDGPPGAAALARILRTLGMQPVLLTTGGYEGPIAAALDAYETEATILTLAREADEATAAAQTEAWLDTYEPSAAIAVEMKGAARNGRMHFMTGRECTEDARLHPLFDQARRRGRFTLGIGDGGNEIGFGGHMEAVASTHPNGSLIACGTATDALVVAAISNWGCYGVEAMLAFVSGRPELLHAPDMGVRALEACAAAGAGDGIFTRPLAMEDGQPGDIHAALMVMLRRIITNGLQRVDHALDLKRVGRG